MAVTDDRVVLVLRALGLGDALTGIPALRGLRRMLPGRRMVLAAPTVIGSWLRDLGLVDDVAPASPALEPLPRIARTGEFTTVNLHGRGPQSHRVLQHQFPDRMIAYRNTEPWCHGPIWRPDDHVVERWCRLVRTAGGACGPEDLRLDPGRFGAAPIGAGCVVVHPGAASQARRWPVERWRTVAAHLIGTGQSVVLTGGPAETELCAQVARNLNVHDLSGQLSLAGLAATIGAARLLICADTGVAHLATALATPSVLLFGPASPQHWGPIIDQHLHAVIWHGTPDRPGDPHGARIDPALERITTGEVVTAAARLLHETRVQPAS